MSVVNPPLVPIGLRDLVKAFTKDLLHKQPQNIPEYAVEYFEKMLPDKHYNVKDYELHGYGDTMVKARKINQYPLSAVFAIFPTSLTQLIKDFIKAVLRENPKNLVEFAIKYFQSLREKNETFTVNYSTYINYINNKKSLTINHTITCPCGRSLSNINENTSSEVKQLSNVVTENSVETKALQKNEIHGTVEKQKVELLEINTNDGAGKTIVQDPVKAVLVLQRFFRKNLRKKRELIKNNIETTTSINENQNTTKPKDTIQDPVKAVLILQRFFRENLKKKRELVKLSGETKISLDQDKNIKENKDTTLDPIKAVLILQRFFRKNLNKKKELMKSDIKVTDVVKKEGNKIISKDVIKAVLILQRFFRRSLQRKKKKFEILESENKTNDKVLKDPVKAVLVLQRFFRSNLKIKREQLKKDEEAKEGSKILPKTELLDQIKAVLILQRFFRSILKKKKASLSSVSTTNIEELQIRLPETKQILGQETHSPEAQEKTPSEKTGSSKEKKLVLKNENTSSDQEEETDILRVDEQGEVENTDIPIVQKKYESFENKEDLESIIKNSENGNKAKNNVEKSNKSDNISEIYNAINPSKEVENDETTMKKGEKTIQGKSSQNDSPIVPLNIKETEIENNKLMTVSEVNLENQSSGERDITNKKKENILPKEDGQELPEQTLNITKQINLQNQTSTDSSRIIEREKVKMKIDDLSVKNVINESGNEMENNNEKHDNIITADTNEDQKSTEDTEESIKETHIKKDIPCDSTDITEKKIVNKKISSLSAEKKENDISDQMTKTSSREYKQSSTENSIIKETQNDSHDSKQILESDIENQKVESVSEEKKLCEAMDSIEENKAKILEIDSQESVEKTSKIIQLKKDYEDKENKSQIFKEITELGSQKDLNSSQVTSEKSQTDESIMNDLVKSICDEYTKSESAKTKSLDNNKSSLGMDVGETVAKILKDATNFVGPINFDDGSSNNQNQERIDHGKLKKEKRRLTETIEENKGIENSESSPEKSKYEESSEDYKSKNINTGENDLNKEGNTNDNIPLVRIEPLFVGINSQILPITGKSEKTDERNNLETEHKIDISKDEGNSKIKSSEKELETINIINPSQKTLSDSFGHKEKMNFNDISSQLDTHDNTENFPSTSTETSIEKRINKDHFYTVGDFQLAEKREFTLDDIPESPPISDTDLKYDTIHSNNTNAKHFTTTPQLYDIMEENSASLEISKESMTDVSLKSHDSNSFETQTNSTTNELTKDSKVVNKSEEKRSKNNKGTENSPTESTEAVIISKTEDKIIMEVPRQDISKPNDIEINKESTASKELTSEQKLSKVDTDKETVSDLKVENVELLKKNSHEEKTEQEKETGEPEPKGKLHSNVKDSTINEIKPEANKDEKNSNMVDYDHKSQLSSNVGESADSNIYTKIEYKHLSESTASTDSSNNNSEKNLQLGRLDNSDDIQTNLSNPDPEKVEASNVDKSLIKIDVATNEKLDEQGFATNIGNNNNQQEQSDRQILQKSAAELFSVENNNFKGDEHEVEEKDEDVLTELQNLKPKQPRMFLRSNTDSVVVQPPDTAAFMDALVNESIGINDNDEKSLDKSFSLEGDIHDQIRQKIFACSLSESNSDSFDVVLEHMNESAAITAYDDKNIKTALIEATGTSTDTESTIVSAVTKIQANARGFLTRKRLRRESLGTKSSAPDEQKSSFGNAAINESLEYLVREAAAKKIQRFVRLKQQMKLKSNKAAQNAKNVRSATSSSEHSLAARRMTLQRGDALRNDSLPDEDSSGATQQFPEEKTKKLSVSAKSYVNTSADRRLIWQLIRRNSMPVQIDSEVFRVLPKHMKKRISSAESKNKNTHATKLYKK